LKNTKTNHGYNNLKALFQIGAEEVQPNSNLKQELEYEVPSKFNNSPTLNQRLASKPRARQHCPLPLVYRVVTFLIINPLKFPKV
jgi:hypothetical protein